LKLRLGVELQVEGEEGYLCDGEATDVEKLIDVSKLRSVSEVAMDIMATNPVGHVSVRSRRYVPNLS